MSHPELNLTTVDLRTIGEADAHAYWALSEAMRVERLPDDPPVPFELFFSRIRHLPSFVWAQAMLARESPGGPLVAAADMGFDTSGDNPHMAQFEIEVLPEYRRRGIGRRLLGWVAAQAHQHSKRTLITASYERIPAGRAFVERMGARAGLESRESQLVLAEVDRDLLARWQAEGAEHAAGFELVFWDNHYPEEHIADFADLCEVMNSAPRGQLEVEDQTVTPEKVREFAASQHARGGFIWTIIAVEEASKRMVGFTEVFGNPARPTILGQGATAVRPEFRGHRLGRWMKAAMLELVISDLPEARFIRTGNATTNAPMLAINNDLGFKPYAINTIWQLETEAAAAYAGEGQGG